MLKMATNPIASVLKQALKTFNSRKEVFNQNRELLKSLLDKITAADVDLQPQFTTKAIWKSDQKAPVTYIDIYEDDNLTMGIFILKPGMKLPLHDHPEMYGLIKVISGTLKISSFTVKTNLQNIKQEDTFYPPIITIEKHPDVIADSLSETCMLDPHTKNLHEIESIGEPAAFLDILSPPYETEMDGFGPRKCTYFKIIGQINSKLFNAIEAPQPSWFWSDSFPYTGPELFKEKVSE